MPFSGIEPGSKLERDIDDCVASIKGDNPGMGKSQAIAICRSRLEKKMSEKEKLIPVDINGTISVDDTVKTGDLSPSERDHEKCYYDSPEIPVAAMGATSFAQVQEAERAQEAAREVRKLANQVPVLVEGIFQDPNIEDKDTAIADLGPEFSALVMEEMTAKERWQPLTDAVIKAIKPLFGKKKDEDSPPQTPDSPSELETKNSFMVYKEADGGYRWLAIYSNKFRDRDNPPEIISEASHLNFIKQVNSGELPYPELRLWHVNGSRWGEADFVGWDDSGFSVASGTVDKGKEWIADSLEGDLLTSHGMPRASIQREDPQDPTVITGHITKEISPLPANVAANEHTGFSILGNEVKQMAFSEEDRAKLAALNIDPDRLEAQTDKKAKETEGLEHKETKTNTPEDGTETGDFVSRDEVTDLVKSVAESTNQLVQVVADMASRIKALEENKLTLDKETLDRTPAASLSDLYKSVIGSEETKVDGRSRLAKSGPQEEPVSNSGQFGNGLATVISQRNLEIERGGVQ